ncbi:MAG: hypothetical protein P8080_04985 [Gammaproteobacteria bacterium]
MNVLPWLALVGLAGLVGWLARLRWSRRRRVRRIREVLAEPGDTSDRFEPATLSHLPEPARAYLRHSIAPGVPLARWADVRMSGTLRLSPGGDWIPFEARERICPARGFLWEARLAVLGRLALEGADWLLGDDAATEFSLGGWIPAVRQHGEELARSAAGRLLVELIWLPSALTPQRGAVWAPGDPSRAVVTPRGSSTPMSVLVDPDGRLLQVSLVRRRVATDGRISVSPFGAVVEEEAAMGDFTVPVKVAGSWGIGTDDEYEFFRAEIVDVTWY